MPYAMKYGDGLYPVNLPEGSVAYVVEPNPVQLSGKTEQELVEEALNAPIGTGKLETLVEPGQKVCIAISDATRSWQRPARLVKAVCERLNAAGIPDGDICIVSGRGTHRAQTEEELRSLVSDEIYDRIRVIDHDPRDRSRLTRLGTTCRGTEVWLNSAATEADRVILIGSVLHHFLAGFSGGRKNVLPGIAAYETVQSNHALSLAEEGGFRASVRSGNLENNPVHLDMCEATAMLKPCFILNTVVDEHYRIVKAFAGDVFQAHEAACALVDRMNRVKIPKKCPVVIASAGGYPKDLNVYQPLKTLCHMVECAAPGATVIMLSESREGFGSPDTEEQMKAYDTMEERERALRARYTIGGATGYLYADTAERFRFIYVTGLPKEEFAHTKMEIVSSLDEAIALLGPVEKDSVCLMTNGSVTLPTL